MVKVQSWFWIPAALILSTDQLFKKIILLRQPQWNSSFLSIHLVQNTGAGFGLLQGQTMLLAMISLVVAITVLWYYPKLPSQQWPQLLWGLFLGGVVGNLWDRLIRNYVVDFMDVHVWPAFNVADAAITIAVIGLIYFSWKEEDNRR